MAVPYDTAAGAASLDTVLERLSECYGKVNYLTHPAFMEVILDVRPLAMKSKPAFVKTKSVDGRGLRPL